MTSILDALGSVAGSDEQTSEFERIVAEFAELELKLKAVKDRHKQLSEMILSEFEETADETQVKTTQKYEVEVSYAEKWKWDSDLLEQKLALNDEVPPFVKRTTTISKAHFEKQDPMVQKEYMPFLTIGVGSPKIKVYPRGGQSGD